jgi:DNA-binding NarL/FixJ family response regulator
MYLENGNSFRQMALLSGISETSIARRIHKLTERLIDSEYIICLRNRNKFTAHQLAIAKDYFLRGLSMKRIAAKLHSTYYDVHQTLKKIQGILKDSE